MANDFAIQITADDAATQIIQKVNAALDKLGGGTDKVTKRTKGMADQAKAGLGKLEDAFKKVERSASLVVDKIVEIVPGLAAISGMAGIAGIGIVSEKFATFGQKLSNNARLVGMNTRELMKFEYAAKRAGQSSESIVSTIGSMQDTIRSAAMGQSPEAMAQLSGWGISLKRNPDGSVANMNDVVLKVMDKINKIRSAPAQRYAAGLFGATGSLPMIQQGQYRSDMDRADAAGFLPADDEIAKGEALKKQLADMGQSFDTLTVKIGSALLPIMGPLVDSISKMLNANNGRIAGQLADAVQRIVDWASNVDWSGLIANAKAFFDAIGGLKGIFMAIVAIKVAGVTANLVAFAAQMAALTGTTGAATGAIGSVVGALGTLGLAAIAAWGALKVAKSLGVPDVDNKQGIEDVKKGNWLAASAHLPAGDFLRAMTAHMSGKSNDAIAASLAAGGNPSALDPSAVTPTPAQDATKAVQAALVAAQATAVTAPAANGTLPLGVRSNNPLNVSPGGREAIYASAEDGIAAATANLRKNYRGLTLEQIADKWTGGARTGNSPQQRANYLAMLTQGTGLGANSVPDLNNQQFVAAMLTRQIQAENGTNSGAAWYSPDQVAAGVARGFNGAPAMVGTAGGSARGADIRVTFDNVPKGARVEAKSSDGAWMPTRINYSLTN